MFLSLQDPCHGCERFNNNFLCHKRINHWPTCQVSLLFNQTQHCSLKVAAPKVRYSFGSFNFLFFQKPTDSLVQCPDKTFNAKYHGLINFEDIAKCTITTPMFTLLPKSPESEKSTLVYKTKPIFVMDTEWLKMTVAFDNNNKKVLPQGDPNPWMTMEADRKDEVRIFGSHTILVNSVFVGIVTIVIIFMLGICLMNCMNYPPKFLQDSPFPFRSKSFSIGNCEAAKDFATPEDEVFIDDGERPVTS